jgi:cell division protein FtsN
MSKKKSPARRSRSSQKTRQGQNSLATLAIPIVVGLVVVVIVVAAILTIENQQPATAGAPGNSSASINTAQPLSTQSMPFPNVPRLTLKETQDKLAEGQAVLIDVRSQSAYDSAHIAGALSIPEEEMSSRLAELPVDKDLILYCT